MWVFACIFTGVQWGGGMYSLLLSLALPSVMVVQDEEAMQLSPVGDGLTFL